MDVKSAAAADAAGFASVHQVRALWSACDPAGIVYYPNYYKWMDEATYVLFERAGLRWDTLVDEYGTPGLPLVASHAEYLSPTGVGDTLVVESRVAAVGRSSFTVAHRFLNGERVAAEGWEKRVWCRRDADDPAKISATPIPEAVRRVLAGG